MESALRADLDLYAHVLEQIRVRGELVNQILAEQPTYPNAEIAALQMRSGPAANEPNLLGRAEADGSQQRQNREQHPWDRA